MSFAHQSQTLIDRRRKTADQVVNNNATPQNDLELLYPVAAGEKLAFEFTLICGGADWSFSDAKIAIEAPAGATGQFAAMASAGSNVANNTRGGVATAFGVSAIVGCVAASPVIVVKGVIINGNVAGTLQLQWSQNAAVAQNNTVFAGSYLQITRLP